MMSYELTTIERDSRHFVTPIEITMTAGGFNYLAYQ